mgnify:FL=1
MQNLFTLLGWQINRACLAFVAVFVIFLAGPLSSSAAELTVDYEVIARSGVTPIPQGVGTFTGFGGVPAIDADGNVVFTGGGVSDGTYDFQSGVYTHVSSCCQKVADKHTSVPGAGGARFPYFDGSERNDIDNGRVVFTTRSSSSGLIYGVYSNVGQASASTLVEVAEIGGIEWDSMGDPYVDGTVISMRGLPAGQSATEIWSWDGSDQSRTYVDPGTGYVVNPSTQAALSGGAVMFWRYAPGNSEMAIKVNDSYETLAVLGLTPVPGRGGATFEFFKPLPAVDRGGLDAAFVGSDGTIWGVFKRADGGALENVADTTTVIPDTTPIPGMAGDRQFTFFPESGLSLANGKVLFHGEGLNQFEGIYTDIGGQIAVLVDNLDNDMIELDGQLEQVSGIELGPKALADTGNGYVAVFKVTLVSGETAVVRATIINGEPGLGAGEIMVSGFE